MDQSHMLFAQVFGHHRHRDQGFHHSINFLTLKPSVSTLIMATIDDGMRRNGKGLI